MNNDVIKLISNNLKINESRIKNVINMLQEGSTIPFIARYRKEMTGNLDEDELRNIETMYKYNVNLEDRKATCINLIKEKGMLTDKIKQEIENCTKLSEVEDIYLPFKEKKKTKGTEAIKLGLEPLANLIMNNINSLCRDSLNGKSPYEAILFLCDEYILKSLNCYYIEPYNVNLSNNLLKYNVGIVYLIVHFT